MGPIRDQWAHGEGMHVRGDLDPSTHPPPPSRPSCIRLFSICASASTLGLRLVGTSGAGVDVVPERMLSAADLDPADLCRQARASMFS